MKYLIFMIIICSIKVFGQIPLDTIEKKTEEQFKKWGDSYNDISCDTLLINSESYFFKKSPISYYKGYTKVFTQEEVFIVTFPFIAGGKGYVITWLVKNKKLYIKKLTLFENSGRFKSTATGGLVELPYITLKEEEINKRIEQFTGEKFNKYGLLPATWVNGELGLLKVDPESTKESPYYWRFNEGKHHYCAIFKNGKLKELKQRTYVDYYDKNKR